MFASYLITLREGIEAALIIGIMLAIVGQLDQKGQARSIWLGVLAAALVSLAAGILLNALGLAFEGLGEAIFEGVMMLLAAGVLTWVIFWMRRHGRQMQQQLEEDVRTVSQQARPWSLFLLAFVAVVREGIETALFLTATLMSTSAEQALLGGLLGLATAFGLGWVIFATGKSINLRLFFGVTSVILLLVAAGLVAHGVHEFQEAGLIPTVIEHLWDINPLLDENSTVGLFLKALLGYNANPSLIEVLLYGAYLLLTGWMIRANQAWRLLPKQIA